MRARAVCHVCKVAFVVRADGRLRRHRDWASGERCDGSLRLVLPWLPPAPFTARPTRRNRELVRLRDEEGLTYAQLAARHGISRQRVHQIIATLRPELTASV